MDENIGLSIIKSPQLFLILNLGGGGRGWGRQWAGVRYLIIAEFQLRSLWINQQMHWIPIFIRITTLHVSGRLSAHHREFVVGHQPRMELQFHPTPGSKWSSQLRKMYQSRCTAKNSWWWAERLAETCRVVIPIKLEFSASFGFIHKESVTMHGHTVV